VYKPLLAVGLRMFVLSGALCYLDHKALWQRNGSYTRTLAASLKTKYSIAMKIITTILSLAFLLSGCRNSVNSSSKKAEVDSANITESESVSDTQIRQSKEESIESDFSKTEMLELTEILQDDFNGDGILDKSEFRKENGKSGLLVIDGKSNDTVIIGLGKKFAHMDNFNWVDHWGILRDRTTYEILFENNEISGDTIVALENPSIILRQDGDDESGGGVITYKDGTYKWIHQSD
jgi:hypothetical protein